MNGIRIGACIKRQMICTFSFPTHRANIAFSKYFLTIIIFRILLSSISENSYRSGGEECLLKDGWKFAYDGTHATTRLLDRPFCEDNQLYVLDGFILFPNVQMDHVETEDLKYLYSDCNPVRLSVTLLPEI